MAKASHTPISSLDFRPILRDLTDSVLEIRRTLRDAILTVLPPGAEFTSRQIADAMGLDKTSGWRCLRVATIADVAGILGSLPRGRGWTKILDALERAGAPDDAIAALRAAVEAFHERIARRGISQGTLEVVAAGELDDKARKIVLRRIRQQHFESTLLVLGVSARARMGGIIVAPDSDGRAADLGAVTLIDGLDRHRDGPPWNIYQGLAPFRNGSRAVVEGDASPFLPKWSMPKTLGEEVVGEVFKDRWRFDFVDRRKDNHDPIRIALCESVRSVGPLETTEPEELVTHAMPHGLPVQAAVFDVLLHRSIAPSATPYAALYANLDPEGRGGIRPDWPEATRLPLDTATEEIEAPDLPAPLEDLSTTWSGLLAHGAKTLGHRLDDFRIHRTLIPHPPVPTSIVVRWGLPVKSSECTARASNRAEVTRSAPAARD